MMIVMSPLKKKKARPTQRKAPSSPGSHRGNGVHRFVSNGSGNGTVYGKRKKQPGQTQLLLPNFRAWKVILGAVIIGVLGVLYLNHVFATRELLREVQQREHAYEKAKRSHADYRLTYDRMIGPKEIYEKARDLGFINGGPADKVIVVEVE